MTEKLETIINREIDKITDKDDIKIEDLKFLTEILTILEFNESLKRKDEELKEIMSETPCFGGITPTIEFIEKKGE